MPRWLSGLIRVNVDKAGQVTTPPGKVQKPKYGDKKSVKAIKPKRGSK